MTRSPRWLNRPSERQGLPGFRAESAARREPSVGRAAPGRSATALELTLSIVSHGHGSLLLRFLEQLNAAPSLAGVSVILTFNLGDETFDPTPFHALRIEVIRNSTPEGFGANHNAAFARCTTPFFAILNPDLALHEGEPFTRLLRRLAKEPGCAIVAPVVLRLDGGREDSVRSNLTPWSLVRRQIMGRRVSVTSAACSGPGTPFFWLAGMCLVVDAEVHARLGGFDERFFLYCEDYDLCARAVLAGHSIAIDPDAAIVHDARRDSHVSQRHLRWHLSSLLRVWTSAAFWRITFRRDGP